MVQGILGSKPQGQGALPQAVHAGISVYHRSLGSGSWVGVDAAFTQHRQFAKPDGTGTGWCTAHLVLEGAGGDLTTLSQSSVGLLGRCDGHRVGAEGAAGCCALL